MGLVLFASWSGLITVVSSIIAAIAALVSLRISARNRKAIKDMTDLREHQGPIR